MYFVHTKENKRIREFTKQFLSGNMREGGGGGGGFLIYILSIANVVISITESSE
jgi:hypothetical protein